MTGSTALPTYVLRANLLSSEPCAWLGTILILIRDYLATIEIEGSGQSSEQHGRHITWV